MLEEVAALGVSYFSECMLDLATNAGIAEYRESANRKKLKESLRSYCKQQKKYNEISSIDEEFDFSAVDEYIINELTDDAQKCLFNADRDTRAEARKHIITKITNLSNAKTDEAKRRIRKQASNSLEIIKQFYFHKVNKEYWFLAAQIVDPIVDELQQLSEDVQNNLSAEIHNAHAEAQNHSLEKMLTEARQGNLKPFQNQIDLYLGALNSTHPLQPYYGYTYRDGLFFSTPLTDEAQNKFPPRFICKGFITVGDKPVQGIDPSVIDYADRHQLPITVNLEEVKKLLGDIPDPRQHEAKYLEGKILTRYPKPFPPAMPYQLLFNENRIINYIELRLKEILDDQTFIVTNEEQTGCNIKIRIEINLKTNRNSFSIRLTNPTNQEILIFLRLLSAASKGGDLTILSLKENRQLLYGTINHFSYQSEFDSIEEECDFIEQVCQIEEYFQESISIPEQVSEKDISLVNHLSTLIRGNVYEMRWSKQVLTMDVDSRLRNSIDNLTEAEMTLHYSGSVKLRLFHKDYRIPIIRTFRSLHIENLERIKKKIEYSDDGEQVRFTFVPGADNICEDRLQPEPQTSESPT